MAKLAIFRNRVDFGIVDQQFGIDVGFYVFQLPFLHSLLTGFLRPLSSFCYYNHRALPQWRDTYSGATRVSRNASGESSLVLAAGFACVGERRWLLPGPLRADAV